MSALDYIFDDGSNWEAQEEQDREQRYIDYDCDEEDADGEEE